MNKINRIYFVVLAALIVFISCKNDDVDYTTIDFEKSKIHESLQLTKAYNDTLGLVYDTTKIHLNNVNCLKYDKLYHQNDSMFSVHYNMFGDMMYNYGMMLNNYTPNTAMMQQGMGTMNGNMNMMRLMADTATIGGYYRNMYTIHLQHQMYHNSIYNK